LVAVVDDHHPLAQLFDILHIVAREDDGAAFLLIEFLKELADALLADDIEADGGLIEEHHAGSVQQGGDEFALHALAQAEFAHLGIYFVAQVEVGNQAIHALVEGCRGDLLKVAAGTS